MAKGEGKVVAQNKKARHDYTIVETIETFRCERITIFKKYFIMSLH